MTLASAWRAIPFASSVAPKWVLRLPSPEKLGEELDHITPLDAGGDEYLAENLQLLCAEHHRLKTALENAQRAA